MMFRNITNQKVTDFIDGYYRPQNLELAKLREFAEKNNVPIFLKDTESFILSLLKMTNSKNLLEIGTAIGYSASTMVVATEGLHVTTIERDDDMYKKALKNIEELGLKDHIELHHGEACEIMSTLSEKYDAVFIDAAKSHYREFFDAALKLSKENTIIICDNVIFKGRVVSDEYDPTQKYKTNVRKMREFIEYLFSLDNMDTVLLPIGDGITITTFKK